MRKPCAEPTHAIFIGMKLSILVLLPLVPLSAASPAPPVRGLHLMAPAAEDIPLGIDSQLTRALGANESVREAA